MRKFTRPRRGAVVLEVGDAEVAELTVADGVQAHFTLDLAVRR